MANVLIPPANSVHCSDCNGLWEGKLACPCESATATPIYVTHTPLGRDDDNDAILPGLQTRYAYDPVRQKALRNR